MSPDMQLYMKAKYGNLPTVEVTKEEFIKLMMDSGKTEKDAEFQAKIGIAMGSACMIGDRMVKIKKEDV